MTPPALVVSYIAAAPIAGGISITIVDAATGHVRSPSAKGFVAVTATPAPTDTLQPITLVGGPNHPETYVALVPGVPWPVVDGGTLVYIHAAAGGPPIDQNPILVPAQPVTAPKGLSFALIVQ